jgi:hypothetical protein
LPVVVERRERVEWWWVEVEVEVAPFFVFGLGVGTTKTKDERTNGGQGKAWQGRAGGWTGGRRSGGLWALGWSREASADMRCARDLFLGGSG